MVKLRMNSADVAAEVCCLKRLIGMRCANIYDLSPKTYVIKLSKSSGITESGESEKALLLLESGVRVHTTEFTRDKSITPSGFTLKLRKHVRTRRLENVQQLGMDRVVDFQFGLGESAYHVILELYAQGNILLTDASYMVLTLLRSHRDDDKGISMMARHHYPVESCRQFHRTNIQKLELNLCDQIISDKTSGLLLGKSAEDSTHSSPEEIVKGTHQTSGKVKKGDGTWKVEHCTIKTKLGEILEYGPVLCDHLILDAGLQPDLSISTKRESPSPASLSAEQLQSLFIALGKFEDWLENVIQGNIVAEGYIFMQNKATKKKPIVSDDNIKQQGKMYDEFSPLILRQYMGREYISAGTFDAAVDEFFSKIEGQRAEEQQRIQEQSSLTKLEKIRTDQTNRVQVLKREVDQAVHIAELIEYNLDDVDAAISAVCTALSNGMDWKDLARMIKEEKKAGNPVAGLIHSLQLEKNQITLLLSNNLDEMEDEAKTQPASKVEIDLSLSAHGNARYWFELKRKQTVKQEKTLAAHEKAFRAAEKKNQQQLAQAKSIFSISHIRKAHWFEKFNWFISSENYLVISGRDAQQNEILVKRYLKKGDLYVHADLHGASSTVIKNNDSSLPISPLTINQAGCFTVCRSQAWDSKIITSAWWVFANQVSKTAPTGEYLTVGSFMIRGKKNFLPPYPLVMGFGLLFRLDESSLGAHFNERKIRTDGGVDDYNRFGIKPVPEVEVEMNKEDFSESSRGTAHNDDSEIDHSGDGSASGAKIKMESIVQVEQKSQPRPIETSPVDTSTLPLEIGDFLDRALQLNPLSELGRSRNKYGLEDTDQATDREKMGETADTIPSEPSIREKHYISIAERRRLKKGERQLPVIVKDVRVQVRGHDIQAEENEIDESIHGSEKVDQHVKETDPNTSSVKEVAAVAKPANRGRKGKLKKIKMKYAEQDDEERQLRMALLASAGKDFNIESKKTEVNLIDKRKVSNAGQTGADSHGGTLTNSKICYKCKQLGHVASTCPGTTNALKDADLKSKMILEHMKEELMELEESDEVKTEAVAQRLDPGQTTFRSDGRPSRRERAKAEENEIAALLAEENVLELDEDEKEKVSELDSLTGKPLPDDVLLYAVPVCGPYGAVQSFKYHVKLIPGTAKKGKAAKIAIDTFSHVNEVTPREKELMKAITEPEMAASMIGNVKIAAPGLTKLHQLQKKGKKSSHPQKLK